MSSRQGQPIWRVTVLPVGPAPPRALCLGRGWQSLDSGVQSLVLAVSCDQRLCCMFRIPIAFSSPLLTLTARQNTSKEAQCVPALLNEGRTFPSSAELWPGS